MSPNIEITNWRKSTRSADNSTCVEAGWTAKHFGFRDTKQADMPGEVRPVLAFSKDAAVTFLTKIKDRS